jgi:hypothetical protein
VSKGKAHQRTAWWCPTAIILVSAGAVTLAGCASDNHPVLFIENATNSTVDVVFVSDDGEFVATRDLEPGTEYPYSNMARCLDATLIARTPDGREVDRIAGPFCRPGEVVIDGVLPGLAP